MFGARFSPAHFQPPQKPQKPSKPAGDWFFGKFTPIRRSAADLKPIAYRGGTQGGREQSRPEARLNGWTHTNLAQQITHNAAKMDFLAFMQAAGP